MEEINSNNNESPKAVQKNEDILTDPLYILNDHTDSIFCATVLKDGRLVTGSSDYTIIIYNNKTFKPDLIIKEHKSVISCLIQLSSGFLVSGSYDYTIKLFAINENKYNVIQSLAYHSSDISYITELKNKQFVSCSYDNTIIFYSKDNDNKYTKDYNINTDTENGPIIQIKDNEVCYFELVDRTFNFFDLQERNIIATLNNISVSTNVFDCLVMITKDLLLTTGIEKITIIDINLHSVIRSIDVSISGRIYTACLLNNNILLTGDEKHNIIKWRIEGDNLRMISKKENAHSSWISTIKNLGNGLVMSGDGKGKVKIWKYY